MSSSENIFQNSNKIEMFTSEFDESYFYFRQDMNGNYNYLTPSAEKILGYSLENLFGPYDAYFTNFENNLKIDRYKGLALNGIKQSPYEMEVYHKNGEKILLEICEYPIMSPSGEQVIAIEGIAKNITQNKKVENFYKDTQEIINVGTWEWNQEAGILVFSDKTYELIERDREVFIPSFENIINIVYEKDKENLKKILCDLNKGIINSIEDFSFRILCRSSKLKYVSIRAKVAVSSDRKSKKIFGTIFDSSRINQSKKFQESLGKFLDISANEVYIFDKKNYNFVYVNRMARKNLEFSLEELREMTPVDIKPDFTPQDFSSLIKPLLLEEKELVIFKTIHRRKTGTLYHVEVRLQLAEFEGKSHFIAIVLDITESVEQEVRLRELNKNLQTEVDKQIRELREKEQLLIQQSKMAAMGEMINNIAHQWRQPLNTISLYNSDIEMQSEMNELTHENLKNMTEQIRKCVIMMSETIDDFRMFFRPSKEKVLFSVKKLLMKVLKLSCLL